MFAKSILLKYIGIKIGSHSFFFGLYSKSNLIFLLAHKNGTLYIGITGFLMDIQLKFIIAVVVYLFHNHVEFSKQLILRGGKDVEINYIINGERFKTFSAKKPI